MVHEKTLAKKAHTLFWFPVKYIKISDNFYKIHKFLGLSWASVITHKELLHLIIWKTLSALKLELTLKVKLGPRPPGVPNEQIMSKTS